MEIIGYLLSVLMGLTLGLIGGGGSILTVPILVYIFDIDPVLATAYSLFVVGVTALLGGIRKSYEGLVNWKVCFIFAVPSLVAVFLTRYLIIPVIPEVLIDLNGYVLSKDIAIMLFFAFVMLTASYSMIREVNFFAKGDPKKLNVLLIILEGLVVGMITGMVGAGGGFMIVPALVLLVGMPVKKAIGTSLVIISIKSLIGFSGDIASGQMIDWDFLLLFTLFSIAGMVAGIYLTRFVSAQSLRRIFGYFILIMAVVIIIGELVQ